MFHNFHKCFQTTRFIIIVYIFVVLGILKKILLVLVAAFIAWAYQTAIPPPPRTLGSPDGPPITSPRIKLRDGRHLSYEESGVPKDVAKSKLIFVHGFSGSKSHHPFATPASLV